MSERHKTLRGMIARRFVSPNGTEAVLEIPAGWSNLKHYTLTTYHKDGSISLGPNQVQCESAAAARAAASECEKKALSQGWLPKTGVAKMAAGPNNAPLTMSLYREDGTPVGCRIKHAACERKWEERDSGHGYQILSHGPGFKITLLANMTINERLEQGMVVLVRWVENNITIDQRAVVRRTEYRDSPSRLRNNGFEDWHIELDAIAIPDDAPRPEVVISRAEFRGRTIDRLADRDWQPQELWAALATDFPDASERQLVSSQIVARRQERQRAAAEEQRRAAEEERRRFEQVMQAERSRPAASAQRQLPAAPVRDSRSLTGGEDITQPKRRKMNL